MDRFQAAKLFIRVVDLGSFSRAAADIGIGQPAATKLVAQLEKQLGSRLLHRSTHGVSPTEIGALYYQKCKLIAHHVEEAETVAALLQSQVQGGLRISTTMDFGRRVMAPLVLRFLQLNPKLQVELLFDDHLVNMVEQGIDVAIRMGRLADSTLGARYLGLNPWTVVASADYLARRGTPLTPGDLASHDALVCSTVQHDARWHFSGAGGEALTVHVKGPLRSNNKSALLTAVREGFGIAALPSYVVHESVKSGAVTALLCDWTLPPQEIHAVYPSPRMVPAKVTGFIEWLQGQMGESWWTTHYSTAPQRPPVGTLRQDEPCPVA
ncbi:MAG: LysR family transcriptional regulator [Polaromonas sp.]|nr:LysR family transcriptional regulator [Polaromonas sp.]MDP3355855.1 LysR family transcriptional regulator [Polaromonas sp.]MDP3753252.1 LysR family transcriptional regulator [Polaromonas sp.]